MFSLNVGAGSEVLQECFTIMHSLRKPLLSSSLSYDTFYYGNAFVGHNPLAEIQCWRLFTRCQH